MTAQLHLHVNFECVNTLPVCCHFGLRPQMHL